MKKFLAILILTASLVVIYRSLTNQGATAHQDSIIISLEVAPSTVDPVAVMDIHSSQVATAVHAPLGWLASDGTFVPMVASEMKASSDAQKLTIQLKSSATFWNGAKVKAEDVVYTIERYRKSQNMHRWILDRVAGVADFDTSKATHIAGLTAIGDDKVEIVYVAPEPDAASLLCNLSVAIVQKGSGEASAKPFGLQAIGCGLYKPSEFEPGEFRCKLRQPDLSRAAELVFRVIPDDAARLSALSSGDVSLVRLRGPMIAEVCESSGGTLKPKAEFAEFDTKVSRVEDLAYVVINWQSPPLAPVKDNDKRSSFLKLSNAMDRTRLAESMLPAGCGIPTASIAPPSKTVAAVPSLPAAPAGAALPAALTLVSANDSASRQLAVAFQKQLQAQGVAINIEFVDLGKLIEKLIKKDFELLNCWLELQVPSSGPYAWCSFFDKSSSLSGFGEPLEDIEAPLAAARGTLDDSARATAFAQVVELINTKQTAWLPLLSRYAVTVQSRGIEPFFDINGTPVNGLIRRQR